MPKGSERIDFVRRPAAANTNFLESFPMLTPEQIALVKATVPVLREHGVALTKHFYARMLNGNPELRQVFNQGHQRAGRQQEALAAAVLAYAENIEDPTPLLGAVQHIASKHVSVGIRAEHYPIVGKHLLASIQEVLGDAATPELIDAWAAAYGQLADILIGVEAKRYAEAANCEGGWSGWRAFRIAEKKQETADVASFTLVPADGGALAAVKPGQFVSVRVYVESEKLMQPRQYTVSAADERSIRISVKAIKATDSLPAGMVSNTLHAKQAGDIVDVSFPGGEFVLSEGDNPVMLLSAGIGITPMIPMAKAAIAAGRSVTFYHLCRSKKDFALCAEAEALAAAHPNVRVIVRTTEDHGRPTVDDIAAETVRGADCYVCGPDAVMQLFAEGVRAGGAAKVTAEKFGTGMTAI